MATRSESAFLSRWWVGLGWTVSRQGVAKKWRPEKTGFPFHYLELIWPSYHQRGSGVGLGRLFSGNSSARVDTPDFKPNDLGGQLKISATLLQTNGGKPT